jgi:5-methylcytosine-specific restriction endonuclease McrA
MDVRTRQFIRNRAAHRCEYCSLHQDHEPFFRFHVEHIVARQHGGGDVPENLALACHHCNRHKGTNLTGVDPDTGNVTRLFHPRQDRWSGHFSREGDWIRGLTSVGRTTVELLRMNAAPRRELRALFEAGG